MTLAAAFSELNRQLDILHESFAGLRTMIVEDKPLAGDLILVERFGNAADDMEGSVLGVLAAAREGCRAVAGPIDLERARRALTTCHERFNQLAYQFWSDLFAYERLAVLDRTGRQRAGEWRAWAGAVEDTLNHCQQQVFAVQHSLFRCWEEVAERVGTTSLSVQATNIGQQITACEDSAVARVEAR